MPGCLLYQDNLSGLPLTHLNLPFYGKKLFDHFFFSLYKASRQLDQGQTISSETEDEDNDASSPIRQGKEGDSLLVKGMTKKEVREMIKRGLTYDEAVEWRNAKLSSNFILPYRFWTSEITAKNWILATLDSIEGFKVAREANDIKRMAELYRKHVIGYKGKKVIGYKGRKRNGQTAFFHKMGGLGGLMAGRRDYLDKEGSPASLLRFALEGLIDRMP